MPSTWSVVSMYFKTAYVSPLIKISLNVASSATLGLSSMTFKTWASALETALSPIVIVVGKCLKFPATGK